MIAIASFLAAPETAATAARSDEDFKGFLASALKSSGAAPSAAELQAAEFRWVDARHGVREGLRLSDVITAWGQPVAVRDLVAACCTVDRTRLVHSLWQLETFDEVKLWLKAVRAVVRLLPEPDGVLRGQLLLAESIIPMVETVERKDYVLPNGDMASDAITRNFGIRAKVFALDRLRRTPRVSASNSIMDRLSRTLSKVNPQT